MLVVYLNWNGIRIDNNMVQVIKNPTHTHTHEVITKQGEVKILLDITVNINTTGGIQVETVAKSKQEEAVEWAIPSFKTDNKIKFGKKV